MYILNFTCALNGHGIQNAERELLDNIISDSEPFRNFIFFGFTLNFACRRRTCEKYLATDVNTNLKARGKVHYVEPEVDIHPELEHLKIRNAGSSEYNVIILKFWSLTAENINDLEVVRKFNMKSYLIVFVGNDQIYSELRNHILTSELFNIYVVKASTNPNLYFIYELCAFCDKGKHALRLYRTWQRWRGFNMPFKLSSSFKGQFFGGHLRVGLKVIAPQFFVIGRDSNGAPIYVGFYYWFLKTLADAMNFKVLIVEPSDGTTCLYNFQTKSLTGFCEMLCTKNVDLAGFPIRIDYLNFHFLDPSSINVITYKSLISANPETIEDINFAVNPKLISAILVIYILSSCLGIAIQRIYGRNNLNTYVLTAIQIYSILFMKAVRFRNLRTSQQVLLGAVMISCLFVVSNMFGEITSVTAVTKPVTNYINTVEDMKKYNVSFIQTPFYKMEGVLERKLPNLKKFRKFMPVAEGLEYILKNPTKYVYYYYPIAIESLIRLHFWDGKSKNPFHFSPPLTGESAQMGTVLFRKDAPFSRDMTKKMLYIEAAGLFDGKYRPDATELLARRSKVDRKSSEKSAKVFKVTLKGLFKYLFVCVIMLLVATVVLVAEFCTPTLVLIILLINIHRSPITP